MTTIKQRAFDVFNQYDTAEFPTTIYARLFDCSPRTVQTYRNEWLREREESHMLTELPLRTLSGIMWREPVDPPLGGNYTGNGRLGVCGRCEFLDDCRVAVTRGDFIACERPIEREVGVQNQ